MEECQYCGSRLPKVFLGYHEANCPFKYIEDRPDGLYVNGKRVLRFS